MPDRSSRAPRPAPRPARSSVTGSGAAGSSSVGAAAAGWPPPCFFSFFGLSAFCFAGSLPAGELPSAVSREPSSPPPDPSATAIVAIARASSRAAAMTAGRRGPRRPAGGCPRGGVEGGGVLARGGHGGGGGQRLRAPEAARGGGRRALLERLRQLAGELACARRPLGGVASHAARRAPRPRRAGARCQASRRSGGGPEATACATSTGVRPSRARLPESASKQTAANA